MKNLITHMRTLMRDDSGQDLLEYALLRDAVAERGECRLVSRLHLTHSSFAELTRGRYAARRLPNAVSK